MRGVWLIGGGLLVGGIGLGLLLFLRSPTHSPPSPVAAGQPASMPQTLRYRVYALPHATVHTLVIPRGGQFRVTAAVTDGVKPLAAFAHDRRTVAVLNGGFFDPENLKSTSWVLLDGQVVADPQQNDRLTANPSLAPYLARIFDRSEFRRYRCGQTDRYAIARRSHAVLPGCQLVDALGAGPQLLPEITGEEEAFVARANGEVIRDPLGSQRRNARSAIGITKTGAIAWVMAAQRPDAPTHSGMTLKDMATFMASLGVETALNLDGGSSSSFYYKGKTIYGKVDEMGRGVERSVKSVLLVQSAQSTATD